MNEEQKINKLDDATVMKMNDKKLFMMIELADLTGSLKQDLKNIIPILGAEDRIKLIGALEGVVPKVDNSDKLEKIQDEVIKKNDAAVDIYNNAIGELDEINDLLTSI